jgi:succinyl-CoA synthetase beta subunit
MRLYEYQGKGLLARGGIATPEGRLARRPEDVIGAAQEIGYPVVIKTQVLTGKRGKAGGIRFASNEDEARQAAEALFQLTIGGLAVEQVWVERKLEIEQELYVSITADPTAPRPIAIFCAEGGMDIEETANTAPEKIGKLPINILKGLRSFEALDLVQSAAGSRRFPAKTAQALAAVLVQLYQVYRQFDGTLVEINPLVITPQGVVAADARVDLDDDAVARHPELGLDSVEDTGARPPTALEIAAGKIDEHDHRGTTHFVQIDPDGSFAARKGLVPIAFDCVGTGTSLTTMDELIPLGYFPVNFCDSSGNPTGSKLYRITKIILSQPHIQGYLFLSCVSSQQLDHTARGIIAALEELYPATGGKPNIPMVFEFRGSWDNVAIDLFRQHGIADCPWVRLLGRDSTEKEAALAFHEAHTMWKEQTGGLA